MSEKRSIADSAKDAFKDHVIELKSRNGVYRTWRCGKPNECIYHFVVTTIPGSMIVTGDLGSIVITRCYDMLPWCRGSIDSIGYFAEKVDRGFETEKFSFDALKQWMADTRKDFGDLDDEDPDDNEKIERRAAFDELCEAVCEDISEREAYDVFSEYFDEPPSWKKYTDRFLWLREAIRWFVTNVKEDPVPRPEV